MTLKFHRFDVRVYIEFLLSTECGALLWFRIEMLYNTQGLCRVFVPMVPIQLTGQRLFEDLSVLVCTHWDTDSAGACATSSFPNHPVPDLDCNRNGLGNVQVSSCESLHKHAFSSCPKSAADSSSQVTPKDPNCYYLDCNPTRLAAVAAVFKFWHDRWSRMLLPRASFQPGTLSLGSICSARRIIYDPDKFADM